MYIALVFRQPVFSQLMYDVLAFWRGPDRDDVSRIEISLCDRVGNFGPSVTNIRDDRAATGIQNLRAII